MNILKETNSQISAELILLLASIIIIVIIFGEILFNLNKDINSSLRNLIETGRNTSLNNL